jgi:hypothetical protein
MLDLPNELPPLLLTTLLDDKLKTIKTLSVELKPKPLCVTAFIQCSSAAVERVFSILKIVFFLGDELISLEDYVCLSLMRSYNKRQYVMW